MGEDATEGVFIFFTVIGIVIYIALVVASTIIAARKGRSAIGWCVATLVFTIAVLFVAIAAPASAYANAPSDTNKSGL